MQTKRYSLAREQTIATGIAQQLLSITNDSDRRANFHGTRVWCKVKVDQTSADNESHGIIAIMTRSSIKTQGALTEADFDSGGDFEDMSENIMAICPWAIYGGSTNQVGGNTFQEIECVFNSSRTLSKGGQLVVICVNYGESQKSVIVHECLLSTFETVI